MTWFLISNVLYKLNFLRLQLLLKFEPKTYPQMRIWSKIYTHTDLSYIYNYFESYKKEGLIFRNTLFRDMLVRDRYNM